MIKRTENRARKPCLFKVVICAFYVVPPEYEKPEFSLCLDQRQMNKPEQ